MTTNLTDAHKFIDGQLVSAKASRIVQAIKAYEPELDVEWIPPSARTEGQSAYRIIHNPQGQPPYVLFYVKTEDEFDDRVLRRIIQNDQRGGKQSLSEFEAWEQSKKLIEQQEYYDRLEEANDIAYHVLRSHKNTYRVDKNTVIRDFGGLI